MEPGVGRYCSACGQAHPAVRDYSVRALLRSALSEVTSYDGRIWRTLRALLFHPGQLARDHFDGKRARFVDPFRIFVLANVAAWLVIPYVNIVGFSLPVAWRVAVFPQLWRVALAARASFDGVTVATLAARITAMGSGEDAATVLCMIPLFALGTGVVMLGRGYRPVQHLVFTAHFYCIHLLGVLLVIGAGLVPLFRVLKQHPGWPLAGLLVEALPNLWVQHFFVAPILFPYLLYALKTAYALTYGQSAWRALILTLWAVTVARLFFDLAFGLVLVLA